MLKSSSVLSFKITGLSFLTMASKYVFSIGEIVYFRVKNYWTSYCITFLPSFDFVCWLLEQWVAFALHVSTSCRFFLVLSLGLVSHILHISTSPSHRLTARPLFNWVSAAPSSHPVSSLPRKILSFFFYLPLFLSTSHCQQPCQNSGGFNKEVHAPLVAKGTRDSHASKTLTMTSTSRLA
jgi:hypothetical protein